MVKRMTTFVLVVLAAIGCIQPEPVHQPVKQPQPRPAAQPAKPANASMDEKIDQLVEGLAKSLKIKIVHERERKTRIAVVPFVGLDGQETPFGAYMAEEITTRLFKSGKADVIERTLLNKALKEQKISASGAIDERTAARLGKLLGAQAICTGTVADLGGDSYKVNARLIKVEYAKVVWADSIKIGRTEQDPATMGKYRGIIKNNSRDILKFKHPETGDIHVVESGRKISILLSAGVHRIKVYKLNGDFEHEMNIEVDRLRGDGTVDGEVCDWSYYL